MKKTLIAMLLLLSLLLGMLAGCGSTASTSETEDEVATGSASAEDTVSETETETATTAEEEAAETSAQPADSAEAAESPAESDASAESAAVSLPIVEEPVTYTMFMTEPFFIASMITDMSTDLLLMKTVQERTNIYFDITAINGEVFEEQFQLMIASGEYADIMDGMSNYTSGYDAAIEEEICIDLYDLVREYAPNYWSAISADVETLAQLVTDEGQMATFAILYAEANCERQGYLLRGDWLEEQGLEVPTTYDELHDMLATFRDAYGSQGMTFSGHDDALLSYGYECAGGDFMVIDGQVVSGYTLDSYYDYIEMCAQWYQEGLLYTDYYTASDADYTDLMVSDSLSVMQGAATSFSTIYAYLDEGDTLTLAAMTPVQVSDDDELHYSWNYPDLLKRTDAWSISATCDDPIPLVQFVDYMYTDEGTLLFESVKSFV